MGMGAVSEKKLAPHQTNKKNVKTFHSIVNKNKTQLQTN